MNTERTMGDGAALGRRLKHMRRERGWTLSDVSARTGLAISTLSKVENNRISLTYNKLARLAAGLEIDLANFFSNAAVQDSFGRRVVGRRGDGQVHESANFESEYLVAELMHRRMVPISIRIKTRSFEEFGRLDTHAGEEFLYVLEGTVELLIEPDPPIRLRPGDCCYFDARAPHAAISIGHGDALVLSVVSVPVLPPAAAGAVSPLPENEDGGESPRRQTSRDGA